MRLVLASGSPRRALLLSAAGVEYTVEVPHVDESMRAEEGPAAYVLRLSAEKAAAVRAPEGTLVLGADTTVVLDGAVLGKPADADEAVAMLSSLSGRTHSVLTGWTIRGSHGERFDVAESLVTFTRRTEWELADYVTRTEPFDKAGGYALQSDDGWLVAAVSGSRANVMGLPVGDIVPVLEELGVRRSGTGPR